MRQSGVRSPNEPEWTVGRSRCFLVATGAFPVADLRAATIGYPATEAFANSLQETIHVPGLRGNPEGAYRTSAVGDRFAGTFENYAASVIDQWQRTGDTRLAELGNALVQLGLTGSVEAKRVNDTQVELHVGRLLRRKRASAHDTVNIADVGFGVSQTLPVLVALLVARLGQLVYIEQPELHLHPKAQTALAPILAAAARRGVKVVVETHSTLLLRAIQTLVAKDELAPDLVKLHWFQRDEDGLTEITSADLDENGAFGQWPEDFDDVMLNTEAAYLGRGHTKIMNPDHAQCAPWGHYDDVDHQGNPEGAVRHLDYITGVESVKAYKRETHALLGIQPGSLVLDAGCGTGAELWLGELKQRDRDTAYLSMILGFTVAGRKLANP